LANKVISVLGATACHTDTRLGPTRP